MAVDDRNESIFGYGSLILPTSLVSRFVDLEQTVDEIYEADLGCTGQEGEESQIVDEIYNNERGLEDENLIREEAEEAWKELKEDINLLPVKMPGFRRTYSFESSRGGAMLEAEYTDDESDYINGIVVTGLSEEQRKKVDSSEEEYQRIRVPLENVEHYLDDAALREMELELPKHIEIYVAKDEHEMFDKKTSRTRNETYHARIMKGIEMLGEIFGEDFAQGFYEDFLESTYERNFLTDEEWVKLSYNDAIEYLFEEVIDKEETDECS